MAEVEAVLRQLSQLEGRMDELRHGFEHIQDQLETQSARIIKDEAALNSHTEICTLRYTVLERTIAAGDSARSEFRARMETDLRGISDGLLALKDGVSKKFEHEHQRRADAGHRAMGWVLGATGGAFGVLLTIIGVLLADKLHLSLLH